MASKMKKLFHRKKDEEIDNHQGQSHQTYKDRSEPALRTSLYDSTVPGTTPQTGEYAIRGNDSSVVLQPSRKHSNHSNRSRRSSGGHENVPYRLPSPRDREELGPYDSHQRASPPPAAEQRRWSRSGLPHDFSELKLCDEQPTVSADQTVIDTHRPHQGSVPPRGSSHAQGYNAQDNVGVRKVNQDDYIQSTYDGAVPGNDHDGNLARRMSIPRKQVATSANMPHTSGQPPASSNRQQDHSRNQSTTKPLPLAPVTSSYNREPSRFGVMKSRTAEDVVHRSRSDTYDTEVIEKVSPAVVHETVLRDVHHIHEERITREIHNHDYFHRILPVIDVEVLPPRHFLPVEGGGLVEISTSEVPGRGNNWVIAETASKIPSDQAAPQEARRFTAREFRGREGDAIKYTAPEGHEVIEQTLVHPPELETGARDTGQSWPLELDDRPEKPSHKHTSSKSGRRKSPQKSMATQASPAQRAGKLSEVM